MTPVRIFLLDALKRVAGGGTIDNAELDAAVPNPLILRAVERNAWEELSHWADDDDIRAKDARFAAFKRERIRDRLAELKADGS